jgi:branched-chain amino acid transport system permease protein
MAMKYLSRLHWSFVDNILNVPTRLLVFMVTLIFLILPMVISSSYLVILSIASIMAVFAASWNFLAASGQVSFGHALFFGVGAYLSAMLNRYFGVSPWVAILLSPVAGFSLALLIGFPFIRVKGPYLSLVTLAVPNILLSAFFYYRNITGGERGIYGLPRLFTFLPYEQQFVAEYYFTLVLLLSCSLIMYRILNSKVGIIFTSILDDELASKACGIKISRYKLMAFAVSGSFASIAGAINAFLLAAATPSMLSSTLSFMIIIMAIMGGVGTIYGSVVGAFILQILDRYILTFVILIPANLKPAQFLAYSVIVMVLVMKWPKGAARFFVEKLEHLQVAKRQAEARRKIMAKSLQVY